MLHPFADWMDTKSSFIISDPLRYSYSGKMLRLAPVGPGISAISRSCKPYAHLCLGSICKIIEQINLLTRYFGINICCLIIIKEWANSMKDIQ